MDFLFTQREFLQSLQTDNQGRKVLVNSTRNGELLTVKPVPDHVLEKPWFKRKMRFPREYLGISRIEERVGKLSYLVHVLAQHGFPTRAVAKSVYRLSLTWVYSKFEDMRKHIKSITQKVTNARGPTRSPWKCTRHLSRFPAFTGDKIHENGIVAPLWSRPHPCKRRVEVPKGTPAVRDNIRC